MQTNKEQVCRSCGGNSFVEAMDTFPLRPLDRKVAFGSEKLFTVCLDCGEVLSIKALQPRRLLKKNHYR